MMYKIGTRNIRRARSCRRGGGEREREGGREGEREGGREGGGSLLRHDECVEMFKGVAKYCNSPVNTQLTPDHTHVNHTHVQ